MPRLILHGGAGPWEADNHADVLAGMRRAAEVGWRVLAEGGSALDAVERATIVLEDDPLFDAGIGSFLNDEGEVEMDALITDGTRRDFGAIAAVRHIRNPITLARTVMMQSGHRFFVADGAEKLAVEFGFKLVPNATFVTEAEFSAFKQRLNQPEADLMGRGTVGAVALDVDGRIASATSTGGSPHKKKGRVGDVPIYGAGGYADDALGGASSTGLGENIMRHLLSKRVVDMIGDGISAFEAAPAAVETVARHIPAPEVGVIAIDANGSFGAAHTTAHMPTAWVGADGEPHVAMTGPFAFQVHAG
ncbi:MAG: isoaspartyl peptidase/L-asparaginase family protein [Phototrophicaceae bacterium]